MGRRPYSDDVRKLVIGEVAAGASRRAAARRFKVSASSAIRWVDLHEESGVVRKPVKRKSRSPLEPHAEWLLKLIAKEPDLTLEEITERLSREQGMRTTDSSVDRFFKRHEISFKKNAARGRTRSARRGQGQGELQGRPGEP